MDDQTMTVAELRAILASLGWTQGSLARRLNRDPSLVRKMCRGREDIDPEMANWLRRVDAARTMMIDAVSEVPERRREPARVVMNGKLVELK